MRASCFKRSGGTRWRFTCFAAWTRNASAALPLVRVSSSTDRPNHETHDREPPLTNRRPIPKRLIMGVISFLTLVDLFAAQAILPTLAASYKVSPAAMAFAVNASTFGMAAAGIVIAR